MVPKKWQRFLNDEVEKEMRQEEPSVSQDDVPESDANYDEADPLFDSGRDYLDQLQSYKEFQGKEFVL